MTRGDGGTREARAAGVVQPAVAMPPVMRMFKASRAQVIELEPVRGLLENFAGRCGVVLREFSSLEATVCIDALDQGPPAALLSGDGGAITVVGHIAEWNAAGVVCLEPLLLFRLLDSMYGGDAVRRSTLPARPLTALERSLAIQLSCAVVEQLQQVLAELCPFSFGTAHLASEQVSAIFGKVKHDYVLVRLRLTDFGDSLAVALPVVGLELARSKLNACDATDGVGLDPGWTEEFSRHVAASSIALQAIIDGPVMMLGDVARLQPGSLLEFDADTLSQLRLESAGIPVYVGRLGQAKGMFTVLVEATAPLPDRTTEAC